jgi:Family of unknown function (DUF5372)
VSATTGHAGKFTGRFRISHPFHPLVGKEYEMVDRHLHWGEDRVFYYDPDGRLKSFLVNITDLFPIDAFTRISAGRSAFRVDDLLELRERLDRQKRGERGCSDV